MIVVYWDRRGKRVGLFVEGHADSGPFGHDLVCSAVSALVQTAVYTTMRLALTETPRSSITSGRAALLCRCRTEEEYQRVYSALAVISDGLLLLAQHYPEHIKIMKPFDAAEGSKE